MKKITAVLLAVLMLTAVLSGCNKKEDDDGTNTPDVSGEGAAGEFVYVPQYIQLPDSAGDMSMGSIFYHEGYIYYLSYIYSDLTLPMDSLEVTPEADADADTEAEPDSEYDTGEYVPPQVKLCKMSVDGKEIIELNGYEKLTPPEGSQGDSNISGMAFGADGNIRVVETMYLYSIDESGNYNEGGRTSYLRTLDQTGAEINRTDLSDIIGNSYIQYMCVDQDGNLCVWDDENSTLKVIDPDGGLLFELTDNDSMWINGMVNLSDDRVCIFSYQGNGMGVKTVNNAAKSWGETYDLNVRGYNVYRGDSEYDFYCYDNSNLYGYDLESKTETKLLNWIGADINSDYIRCFAPLSDGKLFCLTQDWNGEDTITEIILLEKKNSSEVEKRTVLTMACMYIDQKLRGEIINFNKTNGQYRIEVTDYSDFNDYNSTNEEDWNAGNSRLTTEILAGKVPDIIACNNLPIDQYISKGLIEDLYPYIDSDPEISRSDFIQSVITALETDGKLYQAAASFSVQTAIGDPRVIGPEMGWTIDEMIELNNSLPPGTVLFDGMTKSWMLDLLCSVNMSDYVDWDTGKCSFDSDGFIKMLEVINSFPSEYEWSEDTPELPDQIQSGKVLMTSFYASDFESIQMYRAMFGGELVFKGYPTADRNGHTINVYSGVAMSSTCADKAGAWQFIRTLLTEEYQAGGWVWEFPTNKNAFDKKAAQSMEANYYTDENGEQVESPKGGWSWGGSFSVEIYATTQEDVDMILELINSAKLTSASDSEIMNIINEEVEAFFSGSKSARDVALIIQNRASIYVSEQR